MKIEGYRNGRYRSNVEGYMNVEIQADFAAKTCDLLQARGVNKVDFICRGRSSTALSVATAHEAKRRGIDAALIHDAFRPGEEQRDGTPLWYLDDSICSGATCKVAQAASQNKIQQIVAIRAHQASYDGLPPVHLFNGVD